MITDFWWWLLTIAMVFLSVYVAAGILNRSSGSKMEKAAANIFGILWVLLLIFSFAVFGWVSLVIHIGASLIIGMSLGLIIFS